MKGYFAKLKDFSPELKVSEILLFLMPQNRWKKKPGVRVSLLFENSCLSLVAWRQIFAVVCVWVVSDARVAAEGRARVATLPRPRPFAQVAGGRAPTPLGPRSPCAMHGAIRHINAVTLAITTSRTYKKLCTALKTCLQFLQYPVCDAGST